MNGSPSSVISLGFGSWGSVGLVLTLGLGINAVVPEDFTSATVQVFPPRSTRGAFDSRPTRGAFAPRPLKATFPRPER